MSEVLLISTIVSWVVILALLVGLLALSRQIGVLHERIRPVGALSLGKSLATGSEAPSFTLPSMTGGATSLGGRSHDGKSTLVFFLASTCPVCKTLLPIVKTLARQEANWLRVVFASDGAEDEHKTIIDRHGLADFPYVLSTELGVAYQVGKLPYGFVIAPDGIISAHGLLNTREHIESLLEAQTGRDTNVHQLVRQSI